MIITDLKLSELFRFMRNRVDDYDENENNADVWYELNEAFETLSSIYEDNETCSLIWIVGKGVCYLSGSSRNAADFTEVAEKQGKAPKAFIIACDGAKLKVKGLYESRATA